MCPHLRGLVSAAFAVPSSALLSVALKQADPHLNIRP
jgi:hypothetical protein